MRKIAVWLLALALTVALLLAPVRAAGAAVGGRVLDTQGRPVAGALVQIMALGGGVLAQSLTDAGGRYAAALPAAAGALWQVRAWADGYRLGESGWLGAWAPPSVDLSLAPAGGSVRGTLRAPDGTAAPGPVFLLGDAGQVLAEAVADARGRFSLQAPPGRWRLAGVAAGAPAEQAVLVRDGGTHAVTVAATAATVTVRGRLAGPAGTGPAGAAVAALRDGYGVVAQAQTGAGGEFTLAVPASGDAVYRLRVLAAGHGLVLTEPFAAPAGAPVEFYGARRIALTPAAATVVGTVAGLDGVALRAVPVWLELEGVGTVAETATDPEGRFRIDAVAPGPDLRYRVRLSPSYHRMTASVWFTLAGGEVRSEAFVLTPPVVRTEPYRAVVSGRVTDPAGRPLAGAEVLIRRDGGDVVERLLTDENGLFRTLVWASAAGSSGYLLRAVASGYLPTAQVAGHPDGVLHLGGGDVVNLRITLHPERISLRGRVETPAGRLLPGAGVRLLRSGAGPVAAARAAADGSYAFTDLPRGTYVVEAEAPGYARADTGPLALHAGLPPAVLPPLRLGAGGGALAGQVTDPAGLPLAGVKVTALGPAGAPAAETDAEGRWRLEGLPAGVPVTLQVAGAGHRAWIAPAVTLVAGEAKEVTTALFPAAGCLTVRAVDLAGAPAAGAEVHLYREGRGRAVATATAGADGRVTLGDLPTLEGWYALTATAPGGATGAGPLFPLFPPAAGACAQAQVLLTR